MHAPARSLSAHQPLQRTAFATAMLVVLSAAHAQNTTTAANNTLNSVVVTGQLSSIRKAVLAQDAANNILSVVSADDIGALPDINAAEALARMPGLSVQRDQGEGRYVSVRGLGPDLNTVTINGALVPAPENGRRGVSLDVLPSGLIRSLEVSKTLTPDMDANSLGGTVEVKTLSAFDLPGSLLTLAGGVGHDDLSKNNNPFGSLLWASRLMEGKLGVAAGLSTERRKFASDDVETGGAWTSAGKLSAVEFRDYQPQRDRNALALNVDYRPSKETALFAKTFWSAFSDDEVRDRLTISNITGGAASEDTSFTARAERRLRQRKYTRDVKSLVLGGSQDMDLWKIEGRLGVSSANEDQPNALNDVQFRQNGVAGLSFRDTTQPQLTGPAKLYDASQYALNAITFQSRLSQDKENHGKLDLSRKFNWGEAQGVLKFGAKSSRREKTNDTDQWAFTSASPSSPNYWGAGPTTLAGFTTGGLVDFPQAIGVAIDPNAVRARVAGLDRAAATSVSASVVNDWRMNENIDAYYVQASTDFADWNVLVGARSETTRFDAVGNQLSPTNAVTPRAVSRSYTNVLPNLQARYNWDADTSIRAAVTQSVVRANFSQLAPGVALSSPTEATIGNPDLNPLTSTNLDLGVEKVLGKDGVASLYLFQKEIKDFTYTTNLAGTGPWVGYTSALSAVNGDSARVNGVEIAYTHALRMLPGWASGLIVGANATFTNSRASLARFDKASNRTLARDVALPGQSDRVVNLMVGYETGPFSLRVASNTKSRYLLQTGADVVDASQDIWVDGQTQVDLSLRYQITKALSLGFEALNLNREKYYTYLGSAPYNAQNEQYGRTYRLSLTLSQF